MTFEEFKTRAAQEVPKILARMPELRELGAERISITFNSEGHAEFDILFNRECFSAYFIPHEGDDKDFFHMTRMVIEKDGTYRTVEDYSDDGVVDDIPVK